MSGFSEEMDLSSGSGGKTTTTRVPGSNPCMGRSLDMVNSHPWAWANADRVEEMVWETIGGD